MVPYLKHNTLHFLMLNRIDPLETTFTLNKYTIVFVQAVLYLHHKDIEDVDTVELLENESLESAGLVVLHDKITPAKSATSLLRRLMEANLLKTKTAAVRVLYSGRTLLTREQKAQGSQRDVRQSTTGFTGYHMGVRLECVPGSEVYWTTIFCTDNII